MNHHAIRQNTKITFVNKITNFDELHFDKLLFAQFNTRQLPRQLIVIWRFSDISSSVNFLSFTA